LDRIQSTRRSRAPGYLAYLIYLDSLVQCSLLCRPLSVVLCNRLSAPVPFGSCTAHSHVTHFTHFAFSPNGITICAVSCPRLPIPRRPPPSHQLCGCGLPNLVLGRSLPPEHVAIGSRECGYNNGRPTATGASSQKSRLPPDATPVELARFDADVSILTHSIWMLPSPGGRGRTLYVIAAFKGWCQRLRQAQLALLPFLSDSSGPSRRATRVRFTTAPSRPPLSIDCIDIFTYARRLHSNHPLQKSMLGGC